MRSKFRSITAREVAIFKGERWSEFSPFTEYSDAEAAIWLKAALSWANDSLPELKRDVIPVNATLPAVAPEQVFEVLQHFGKFSCVKIKVGEKNQSRLEDLERIKKVSELFPEAKIRLDANGSLGVDAALLLCEELRNLDIEYFEQPVETIEQMRNLRRELERREIPIKIAADELIRKADDPFRVVQEDAADIAVLKVQPLGGLVPALRIADQIGIDCVVSSALESSVGLAHGLHLAAAMNSLKYDCGLATASLLAADVTDAPLVAIDGVIQIREVKPSQELLLRYAAPKERKDWWLARIERCLELLES